MKTIITVTAVFAIGVALGAFIMHAMSILDMFAMWSAAPGVQVMSL